MKVENRGLTLENAELMRQVAALEARIERITEYGLHLQQGIKVLNTRIIVLEARVQDRDEQLRKKEEEALQQAEQRGYCAALDDYSVCSVCGGTEQ
jgi:chromosome segregation ATPase